MNSALHALPGDLDVIGALRALQRRRAQPMATCLHVTVQPHALVVCPLALAGAHGSVHVVAYGPIGQVEPHVLVAPDPRHPTDREALLTRFGADLATYMDHCRAGGDYPQLWVAGMPTARHLGLVAERLRIHDATTPPGLLARHLAHFAARFPVAGQQALHVASRVIADHWATAEPGGPGAHLGALLLWFDAPTAIAGDGTLFEDALAEARNWPMGVRTDPVRDAALHRAVVAYNRARRSADRPSQGGRVELDAPARAVWDILVPAARHAYDRVQRAVALIAGAGLAPLRGLDELDAAEVDMFAYAMDALSAGRWSGRSSTRSMARSYLMRQAAQENVDAALVLGDRVARARACLAGTVVAGTVVAGTVVAGTVVAGTVVAERIVERRDGALVVRTAQSILRVRSGDQMYWADDTRLRLRIEDIRPEDAADGATTLVILAITRGQRSVARPSPGAAVELVPAIPDWGRALRETARLSARPDAPPWAPARDRPPGVDA